MWRAAVDAAAFCCQRFALAGSAATVAVLLLPLEALLQPANIALLLPPANVALLPPPLEALPPLTGGTAGVAMPSPPESVDALLPPLTGAGGAGSSVSARTRPRCGALRKIVAENEGSSACHSMATPLSLSPTIPRPVRSEHSLKGGNAHNAAAFCTLLF